MGTASWARRSTQADGTPREVDRRAALDEATWWAYAAVSCAVMGGGYVPFECWQWAITESEEELLLLRPAQLVLATVESTTLVLDFLALAGTGGHEKWAPVTIRASVGDRRRRTRVPAPLRRWAKRAQRIEISLRDRAGVPVVRIFAPHSGIAFEVESVTPELVPLRR